MRYLNITKPDINNGLGCRVTLWIAGCGHNCKGCHNPESHNYLGGKVFDDDTKNQLYDILKKPYIKGITLSGGDPFMQSDEVLDELINLVKEIKDKFPSKDIWGYTGYYYNELNGKKLELADLCDVIVDGPYIEELRDTSLAFRGSSNQHILAKSGLII